MDEYIVDCMSEECWFSGLSTECHAEIRDGDYTLFCPECGAECEPVEDLVGADSRRGWPNRFCSKSVCQHQVHRH